MKRMNGIGYFGFYLNEKELMNTRRIRIREQGNRGAGGLITRILHHNNGHYNQSNQAGIHIVLTKI